MADLAKGPLVAGLEEALVEAAFPEAADSQAADRAEGGRMLIKPGKYRHYKGNDYEVIGTAKHSETLEELVIYRALYGNKELWARPAKMFIEKIEIYGTQKPRFEFID